MRILVARDGGYPARDFPASTLGLASYRLTDVLVKGLVELGHDVFYEIEGVPRTSSPVDVAHRQTDHTVRLTDFPRPWVRPCHVDVAESDTDRSVAEEHWIYVSHALARLYGGTRVVLNGIDPSEFVYSETKNDYFLFAGCLDRALLKGFDIAASLAKRLGFRLVIAGSAPGGGMPPELLRLSASADVVFAGEVSGARRAELFAGARALLFPTQHNEAFGLVMAEALMSGTPVICSDRGACAELISEDVGFVCSSDDQYLAAVANIDRIEPSACRAKAMRDYHYLRMARDYVREYEREIARC